MGKTDAAIIAWLVILLLWGLPIAVGVQIQGAGVKGKIYLLESLAVLICSAICRSSVELKNTNVNRLLLLSS